MAYVDNTAQGLSHNENTVREDLADLIAIMSPVDMPLFSILAHVPIHQRKFDWAMDTIPFDDDPTNIDTYTSPEGKDAAFTTPTGRERPFNFAQINSIAVDVSDTARVVEMAGVGDEFEYQIWKRLLELGRRMEYALHFGVGADHTGIQTDATGRGTHGIVNWIAQTGAKNAQSPVPATETLFPAGPVIPSAYYSTYFDAAHADLTRVMLFNEILSPAWRNGFNVGGSFVFSGAKVKQFATEFSAFGNTSLNFRQVPAEAKILYDTIDVIDTNLGPVYWNLDRYLDIDQDVTYTPNYHSSGVGDLDAMISQSLIAIEPRFFQVGILRGVGFKPLAPVGDSSKGMFVGEWGARVLSPVAGCGGTNLIAP